MHHVKSMFYQKQDPSPNETDMELVLSSACTGESVEEDVGVDVTKVCCVCL